MPQARGSGWKQRIGSRGKRRQAAAAARQMRNRRGKQAGNLSQLGAGAADGRRRRIEPLGCVAGWLPRAGLRAALAMTLFQCLTGAGERISFGVNQALDLQRQLHIAPSIEALAGAALVGLELRKLRLPKTQNIGLHIADAGDVSNLEVETVRDHRCFNNALAGKLCSHIGNE